MRILRSLAPAAVLLALALPASATTLTLSQDVSEPQLSYSGTPLVDLLDATVTFDIVDVSDPNCSAADCLKITLTNDTDQNVPTFLADINALAFSATANVTTLTVDTLPANWQFDVSTGQGGPTHLDGFGIHDYAVSTTVSGGPSFNPVPPGGTYIFTFATNAGLTMYDFVALSEQTPTMDQELSLATAKFVRFRNGPDTELDLVDLCDDGDPLTPVCDSAFGAVVLPEPAPGLLYALGVLGLAYAGRPRTS